MDAERIRLGMAPIGWTNDDMPDLGAEVTFEQCISEIALAGYEGSEVGNKYPKDPAVLRKHLDLRNLTICNQWFSTFLCSQPYPKVEKAFREQIRFLSQVGAEVIVPSEKTRSCQGDLSVSVFCG